MKADVHLGVLPGVYFSLVGVLLNVGRLVIMALTDKLSILQARRVAQRGQPSGHPDFVTNAQLWSRRTKPHFNAARPVLHIERHSDSGHDAAHGMWRVDGFGIEPQLRDGFYALRRRPFRVGSRTPLPKRSEIIKLPAGCIRPPIRHGDFDRQHTPEAKSLTSENPVSRLVGRPTRVSVAR